jgi:hypothetical protein
MEEKEESQSFRVVDKRRFTSEASASGDAGSIPPLSGESGRASGGSDTTKHDDTEKETKKTMTEASASDENKVSTKERENIPPHEINFSAFLMGIYTQILIFLGDIPNPETNLVSVNLEAAKQNIAVLSIIEEKTKGNLTPEEEHLFKEILTTVRLQFVKKIKK